MKSFDGTDPELLAIKADFLRKFTAFYYSPIDYQQSKTTVDKPATGPIWVSRATISLDDGEAIVRTVVDTINELGTGEEVFAAPSATDVKLEWNGHRRSAGTKDSEPDIGEKAKYQSLCSDCTSETVIYFAHGGFYFTGSPTSSRPFTTTLTKQTGARCASLDYRLCPQNTFPAALVDVLAGYLSLLYPSPTDFHTPVRPKSIVLAGESAGGNLMVALLLLIQHIHKTKSGYITYANRQMYVPFPAGFAGLGCHLDFSTSFPHQPDNFKYDFLTVVPPYMSDEMPTCPNWPSDPPRGEIYCETSMLCHPLVSSVASKALTLLPPLFIAYGEEYLGHAGRYLANRAHADGVTVQFHHYEHQMHVFPILFPFLKASQHFLESMSRFCHDCTTGEKQAESMHMKHLLVDGAIQSVEDEKGFVQESLPKRLAAMRAKQADRKVWNGPRPIPSL